MRWNSYLRATALISGLALASTIYQPSHAAETLQAPHIGQGGLPQFAREHNWVKLPAAWTHGAIGAGVTVDEQNHIWVMTRPNALLAGGIIPKSTPNAPKLIPLNLSKAELPPPVIEFDENGNVLQAWG